MEAEQARGRRRPSPAPHRRRRRPGGDRGGRGDVVGRRVDGRTGDPVSANLASIEELAASFTAAGIPNAERWAEEVDEYRPYPDDPEWAKLRKELGKYNIDPEVLDAILSCIDNH